jgi:sugar phosphate isomerase/epimerase
LEDFAETLRKVAEIGYKTVQVSGTCEYDAEWLKAELDKNGLKCVLTHIPLKKLVEETDKVIRDHEILECDNIGLGWFSFKETKEGEKFDDFMQIIPGIAKKIADSGKYFMYHNHAHEFKKRDGKVILEHLKDTFDPKEFGFVVDTYWVQAGGGDPAQWIEDLFGRVPCIHLKDYSYDGNDKQMAVVGEGNLNLARILKAAEAAGTEYLIVEQDQTNGEDPFDCLRRSYENLKKLGYE